MSFNFNFGGTPQPVRRWPDFMVDIESMGTNPDAPVVAIGAVAFDLVAMEIGPQFYTNVALESSMAQGATPDADTILWWFKQSQQARERIYMGVRPTVNEALGNLTIWLNENTTARNDRRIYACGTDFDVTLLTQHYKRAGLELPWHFWNSRDQRTLRELWREVSDSVQRNGTHHNALDDALYQVEIVIAIRKHLVAKGKV